MIKTLHKLSNQHNSYITATKEVILTLSVVAKQRGHTNISHNPETGVMMRISIDEV